MILLIFKLQYLFIKFHNRLLPVFDEFFTPVNKIHKYNTRHASKMTFSLPNLRTNYSIFNIRFQGTKIWNGLDESIIYHYHNLKRKFSLISLKITSFYNFQYDLHFYLLYYVWSYVVFIIYFVA